jgi:hypothetical protein
MRNHGGDEEPGNPWGPGQNGEWPWDQLRAPVVAKISDDELASIVALTARKTYDGHAYSSSDLNELRKILRIEGTWPDSQLHRHTDELAAHVGLPLITIRRATGKEYRRFIATKLLTPAKNLRQTLCDWEMSLEFDQPWLPLHRVNKRQLVAALKSLIAATEDHVDEIARQSAKGKSWDSDIKRYYVKCVDLLCEYLNHKYVPSRRIYEGREDFSQLRDAVYLLSSPWPWGENKGVKFVAAIRERVDEWNASSRELRKLLLAKRDG